MSHPPPHAHAAAMSGLWECGLSRVARGNVSMRGRGKHLCVDVQQSLLGSALGRGTCVDSILAELLT